MLHWHDAGGCVFIAYADDFRIRPVSIPGVDRSQYDQNTITRESTL
jgi:hypothetical protein